VDERGGGTTIESPSSSPASKRRLPPLGNPAKAPSVYRKLWRRGPLGRSAVIAYCSAIVIGVGIGVLYGMVSDPHRTDKSPLRWTLLGLTVTALCLLMLGGYFYVKVGRAQRRTAGASPPV